MFRDTKLVIIFHFLPRFFRKTNKKKIVTDLSYRVWNGTSMTMLSESKIFATIEELTASLVGEYEKGAKR